MVRVSGAAAQNDWALSRTQARVRVEEDQFPSVECGEKQRRVGVANFLTRGVRRGDHWRSVGYRGVVTLECLGEPRPPLSLSEPTVEEGAKEELTAGQR